MTLEPEEEDLRNDPEWMNLAHITAAVVFAVRDEDMERWDHLLHNLNWQREGDGSAINAWAVMWELANLVLYFSSDEHRNLNKRFSWDQYLMSFAGEGTVDEATE